MLKRALLAGEVAFRKPYLLCTRAIVDIAAHDLADEAQPNPGMILLGGSNTGPGGGAHQQLINRLRNPDSSVAQAEKAKSKILGPMLEALKIRRHLADYQLGAAVSQPEASTAVANAKLIAGKVVV